MATKYPIQTPDKQIRGWYRYTPAGPQIHFNSAEDEAEVWRLVAKESWAPRRLVTTQARPQSKPQPQRPLTTAEHMARINQARTAGVPEPPNVAKAMQAMQGQATQTPRPAPTPHPVPPMLCPGCRQRQCTCGVPEPPDIGKLVVERQKQLGLR